MSRREALRTGGLAVVGVAAITPADAWAKLTGHCPHKHPHRCSGKCVDTQSDFHNCGACGTVCSSFFATSSCQSGTCHIDSCSPNWVNCDGDPLTGCETLGTTCPP